MTSTSYTTPRYGNLQTNDTQLIQRLIQSITVNIQKIAQNVSQIENMNMQIGTLKDSEGLREKLLQTENFTNQLAKDTNKQLKELNSFVRNNQSSSSEDRQFKIQKERLTNDLVKTLNKFQEVQKLAMQKQKESNERAKANMSYNSPNEDAIRLQTMNNNRNLGYDASEMNSSQNNGNFNQHQQSQRQIGMEADINLTQLREREAALHKLENDITDVNMIFKDLAVMVHDQGDIIDSIESNVEQVQIRVNDANSHLVEAKKNQSKARKKKVILLGILATIAAIIILIIVISLKPWSS
jgi:t-SNARE complex subunit (syntaxin)